MKRVFLVVLFFISTNTFAQEYDSLVKISKQLRNDGEYSLAIENYEYLINKFSEDKEKVAYLYNVISLAYNKLGVREKQLFYLYEAIRLNKKIDNKVNLVKNYINISLYYSSDGQIEKSNTYLFKALVMLNKREGILYGKIMNALGQNYSRRIDDDILNADTASIYYLKAIPSFKVANDKRSMAIINNDLAILYKKKGNLNLAKDHYEKSIELSESNNFQDLLVSATRNLGILYMEESKYQKAVDIYNKSLSLSSVIKNPKYYKDIYYNLVQANMALGKVDTASLLLEKFTEIRDSIYNLDNLKRLKEMETKYETELKEQELKAQEKTIASTVFEKNIFLSLSILLLLLIGLSIWFFNQKQKYLKKLKNEEIENMKKAQELKELNAMMHGQEEERNRIASDLHDRLGARLSSIKLLFQGKEGDSTINNDLISHIDEAIKETREISHNLSTDILTRFGVETALKDMMRTLEESGKISTELIIYGLEARWPLEIERNVYFILLELINNTLKHAQAASITIQISQIDGEVNVFYEDDGQGFDTTKSTVDGLGLRSLQARIGTIGGNIELNSQLGKGIQAVITFETVLKEAIKEN